MTWFIVISMALLVCAIIIFLARLPKAMWVLPCAAGALALAGYAYQGRPDISSSFAKPIIASNQTSEQLIMIRQEMDYQFGAAKRYLITSDSAAKDGNYSLAAAFLRNGLNKYPENAELWGALGLQLMLVSEGRLTPPAKLAFDRSRKLWPKGPVPDYFEGLASLFEGRADEAEEYWTNALNNASKKANWRPMIERQLKALKQLKETNKVTDS